ncbi:hypothetical protein GWK26_09980 [haloarchaeon 3A1-DGR]|nr:hypothetical protein GWK26_09980 [haloarchaeon 3A1-DGR]
MATETTGDTKSQTTDKVQSEKTYGMTVNLPRVPPHMEDRIEENIRSFEQDHEEDVFAGRDGEIPRVTFRDYLFEAAVGIVLTIYLLVSFT